MNIPTKMMKVLSLLGTLALAFILSGSTCKPPSGPTGDAEAGASDGGTTPSTGTIVEAGVAIATGFCSLVEGVDSGVVRTICATVDEVATIVQFILTLRTADAGALACVASSGTTILPAKGSADAHVVTGDLVSTVPLPGTTFCATSTERAKGVLFLSRVRDRRLQLDGGMR